MTETDAPAEGALALNILHFARALRDTGIPVGPGAVLDAVAAVEAVGFSDKTDFREVLHAVFVKKHEHTLLFDQVFDVFWKRKGLLEKLIAMLSPQAPADKKPAKAEAGASRVADAMFKSNKEAPPPPPSLDLDARLTMSATEILQTKDFAQMSAKEIAEARALIAKMRMPDDLRPTRRFSPSHFGQRFDPRRTFRRSLRGGGALIDLAFRARAEKHPPVVALCDISGSMAEYTRLFLHFLHALGETRRVTTFLFGTRLTNVTRAMRARDPDEALARCSQDVADWSGGTRISASLHRFNRDWSRRVLSQGPVVLLFTDGLERDGLEALGPEMERLHKSCRRLIWLNPLLRWEGFQPKSQGIRAMLPYVDEFRTVHNLDSLRNLIDLLSRPAQARGGDPWRTT